MRILTLAIMLALPVMASAQSMPSSLLGTWRGDGYVNLKPNSKSQAATCSATFQETRHFWLSGAVVCKKGRRTDRVDLRFSEPSRSGALTMHIVDRDGDALVRFEGEVVGDEITLFHPEVLTFSGQEYRPVLRIDSADGGLRLSQFGLPTRSSASQYVMSDFIFQKDGE